jgi:hypothetical protein
MRRARRQRRRDRPQIEREVVPGSSRDARIGQILLGCDRGDDRPRAVATGHRQRIGAAGDRGAHELLQVAARRELDRLDAAGPRLVGEIGLLGLAAAGLRVEEENRVRGVGGDRDRHVRAECALRRGEGRDDSRPHQRQLQDAGIENHDQDRRQPHQRRRAEADDPWQAPAQQAVPRRDRRPDHEHRRDQTTRKAGDDRVCRSRDRQRGAHDRDDRCKPGLIVMPGLRRAYAIAAADPAAGQVVPDVRRRPCRPRHGPCRPETTKTL